MDGQYLSERVYKYIWMGEKPKIRKHLLYAGNFIGILIIKICVSLLKQVKTDSNLTDIVQIAQELKVYGKITHEMVPKKYIN